MLTMEMALRTFGIRRSSARRSGFGCPFGVMRDVGNTVTNADAPGTIPPKRGEAEVLIVKCLPPAVDPFLKVGSFGANCGVEAVARQNNRVCWKREELGVDGVDDGVKVATL